MANLQALRTLRDLEREQRPATADEQRLLARWGSWGAVPQLFDETREEWAALREQLRELLDGDAWAAARRTTINAHYTDPAIAREIWRALGQLGFEHGRVLEPGAGAGVFIALAPDGAQMTGVELDPTTAQIAAALYPQAEIRCESFADTRLPDGYFDATVGNVPFADVRLHDPRHNAGRHSLHNHFILKSLALTRPGGLVAVLTSSFTLDATNPAARREINQLGELLGAVRLPTGAHRRAAGTEALTDLLILQRRPAGTQPDDPAGWECTRELDVDGSAARINSYFIEHPDRVLGTLEVGRGMYGAHTLQVRPTGSLTEIPEQLAAQLADITRHARAHGHTLPPRPDGSPEPAEQMSAALAPSEGVWDGHIAAEPDGAFTITTAGIARPLEVARPHRAELRELLALRGLARALLAEEAATLDDTPELGERRGRLRDRYTHYLARYGPINRFTLRPTGRLDPDSGEQQMARLTPRAVQLLRSDPFAPLVRALEVFDETTQTATPATLLSERVVAPRVPRLGADTPQDALAICLDTHGRVDLQEIASLLGQHADEARRSLGELVYHDPELDRLVPAVEYLSGNVRVKLDAARAGAEHDAGLAANVAALAGVLPVDLGMEDVEARLGAAWIDADAHREFLAEILQDPTVRVEHPGGAVWAVRANNHSVRAISEWGTGRMPASAIAKAAMEQRPIQITDEIDDGERTRRVVNPTETAAAQEKAGAMQERFAEWVWEQPDRARRLLAEYNRRFNSIVLRDYTTDGEALTLPGLARTFTPLPHQRAAVARIVSEPAVGLFHQVGAGKTAAMAIAVSELRRLQLVRKPCLVVPNHMLEQFSREYLQLYPQARLLAASTQDLAGEKRRTFVARVAANDWDAVLMTRSAFERIPVSPQVEAAYVRREIDSLRGMLANAKGGDGLTVKRLERMVLVAEQRLQERLDTARDLGVTFEQTGIDYLVVDEAHDYKNLHTPSNIRDATIDGSKRASDLHMKVEYLRQQHGGRTITMATATPIANSMTEAHVMQRYLRPDLLRDAGVEDFDAWAATFGQTVTEIEMAPTGGGNYRMHTRFARFQNVPEMLRIWNVFADVKTAEDLKLPTPELAARPDGQRLPHTVLIPGPPELRAYVHELGERAERVRGGGVAPEEDNMLKISTDGRKAALDMRLITGEPASGRCKLDVAAETISGIWRVNSENTYSDPNTGQRSPTPGALQIVFCDLSTPSSDWNAYRELRDQLADRGVPAEQVRFIHEARNDAEKARLFAACRTGQVAVIVGSTAKMGVGTNIQHRAIALHHLDCPWRPADIEQREGRAMRQGNQNPEIEIYRYAVEGSFDAYSWQTVERKARFINQITRGRLDARQVDDVGDNALSFAEVKALASGDPLILDKARADADHTRLTRLNRAWQRSQQTLRHTLTGATGQAEDYAQRAAAVTGAIARRQEIRGDAFHITIDGQTASTRAEAGEMIARWATINQHTAATRPLPLGQLAGLDLDARVRYDPSEGHRTLAIALRDVPATPAEMPVDAVSQDASPLIRQLEHRVRDLPALAQRLATRQQDALSEADAARHALTQPFKYAVELDQAATTRADIDARIKTRHDHDTTAAASDAEQNAAQPCQDPDVAEAQRLAAAAFPSPTPVPGASTYDTSRPPRQTPPRIAERPSRSR